MKFVKKSGIEYNFLERLSQRTFLDKYSRNFLVLPFHDLSINLSLIFAAKYRVKKEERIVTHVRCNVLHAFVETFQLQ